jgi:hypothetical protein
MAPERSSANCAKAPRALVPTVDFTPVLGQGLVARQIVTIDITPSHSALRKEEETNMAIDFEDVNSGCNESQAGCDDSDRTIYDEIYFEAAMQDLQAAIEAGEFVPAHLDDPFSIDVPF